MVRYAPNHMRHRSTFVLLGFGIALATQSCASASKTTRLGVSSAAMTSADPLPSWNEGETKRALLDFVVRITDGADFVPPSSRIAVFDDDGTLWSETPVVESAFAIAQLEKMAKADPSLRERPELQAALEHDATELYRESPRALLDLVAVTQTGMTDAAYAKSIHDFLVTARHPRFQRPYTELTYRPMIELLGYLRRNGFTTYISTSSDLDFVRAFSSSVYGVAPEHVIGSCFKKRLVESSATQKTELERRPEIESLDDRAEKPVGIDRQIGRRPIFAAGNVGNDGDIDLLRYTLDRGHTSSFAIVIHHDDALRESAYEERDGATLDAARTYGIHVVSMQRDWRVVFTEGPPY
jgi:hypothetical protein